MHPVWLRVTEQEPWQNSRSEADCPGQGEGDKKARVKFEQDPILHPLPASQMGYSLPTRHCKFKIFACCLPIVGDTMIANTVTRLERGVVRARSCARHQRQSVPAARRSAAESLIETSRSSR